MERDRRGGFVECRPAQCHSYLRRDGEIITHLVELPVKDAAEFIAGGGTAEDVRRLIKPGETTNKPNSTMQVETSNDGSMLFTVTAVSIAFAACRRWGWSGSG